MRSLALLLAAAIPATAQPPADPPVPPVNLNVRPAAAPVPALRYELLPNFREQVRGNAVLSYYRAIVLLNEHRDPEFKKAYERDQKIDEMAAGPLKDIKTDRLRDYLQGYRNTLREVENGARRTECDWELERRIDVEGMGVLLPEVQKLRELARLLSLRIRLRTAEGDFEGALADVRTGFALARHAGDGPTLIQALVGFALFQIFAQRLEQMLEMPDCPNMYWALTALPRPFHDMRRPLEGETRMIEGTLPLLRDLEKGPMTAEQVRHALEHWAVDFERLTGSRDARAVRNPLALAALVTLQYPNARRSLLAAGRTPAEIDAMPAGQVVLLDSVLRFKGLRDETFVWFHVPYYEARAGMAKAASRAAEMRQEGADIFGSMLLLLLPAVEKVHIASARTERKIAVLRTVEALRMHAAAHGGRFPAALSEVMEVPVPLDPVTGKPFEYELAAEGRAILTAPPPQGQRASLNNAMRYELTLKK
jgi:hypothetical protein